MKTGLVSPAGRPPAPRRSRAAIGLVECLVYLAVFVVIAFLAFNSFFRLVGASTGMRRNADDIVAAMQAGERWRADVRELARAPEFAERDGVALTLLPHTNATVAYFFASNTVWRAANINRPPVPLLRRVRASRMVEETRPPVTAWKWDVELITVNKNARTRPVFTFLAVPPPEVAR